MRRSVPIRIDALAGRHRAHSRQSDWLRGSSSPDRTSPCSSGVLSASPVSFAIGERKLVPVKDLGNIVAAQDVP
jgi:hypothetical protein